MPFDIAQIGMNAANQAASGILGIALGHYNDQRQLKQQQKLQNMQIAGQKEMGEFNKSMQMQMWNDTNFAAQKAKLQEAGLNPALLYGMGGPGGATAAAAPGQVSGADAPKGGREIQEMMGMGLQYSLLKAQIDNINADTKNKLAGAGNLDAQKENTILQQIITKFAGKEAERQWNINKELSAEEYGAKSVEFQARSATANNIIKLSEDGTLQNLSHEELQKLLKGNKLIDAQVNGQTIQNAINELEKEMQTKLGIDSKSPTWLKIIGRLIMGFIK